MHDVTFTVENRTEALILEQALAFARQLSRTADGAADGRVLVETERLVLNQGRGFLREAFQIALQSQAEVLEKKGLPCGAVRVASDATTKEGRSTNC